MPISLLREGDERLAPVVFVHPVSGHTRDYQPLADRLDWKGPILGIEAAALPPGDTVVLGDLAERYRGELDPAHPAILLGWGVGGVIAAEVARLVTTAGGDVRFLGLLDSRAPVPEMKTRSLERDTVAKFYLFQRAVMRDQEPPPPPALLDAGALFRTLTAYRLLDPLEDPSSLEADLTTYRTLTRAFFQHDQRPVGVPIHLFESSEQHASHPKPPTLGWEPLTPRLERIFVAGTHFNLLSASRVDGLARTISTWLMTVLSFEPARGGLT
ncbi:hypothetical protein BH11MYX1_BH11MYX1_01330 [soil metagenome]